VPGAGHGQHAHALGGQRLGLRGQVGARLGIAVAQQGNGLWRALGGDDGLGAGSPGIRHRQQVGAEAVGADEVTHGCPSSNALRRRRRLANRRAGSSGVECPGPNAWLDTSSIAFVLDCHVWSNHSVCVTARNVSASTGDLAAAPLIVQLMKRRVAWAS
jgi:hypothetical protein